MRRGTLSAIRVGMLAVGAATAGVSVWVARRSPDYSFAGASGWAVAVEVSVCGALILAAARWLADRARRTFAVLLFASALCWLVVEWNNPGIDSAPAFTTGLVFSAGVPAFIAHAALRYIGKLGPVEWVVVGVGYLCLIGAAGLGPALAFDPRPERCNDCPVNLLTIGDWPRVVELLTRSSIYTGIGWVALAVALLVVRLARLSAPRRRLASPVLVAAAAYLCGVAGDYLHSTDRGYLGTDPLDRRYRLVQAMLLIALALASAWPLVVRQMTRSKIARLVVRVGSAPRVGALAASLGAALGDGSLRLIYPLADGRFVDAAGQLVASDRHRPMTKLLREESTVALLEHRPGLLDDRQAVEAVADAAGLALENERLRAERLVQLGDLRTSRARIVAAGDAERCRLERDLHDGAQQQLVTLALGLQLAQLRADTPAIAAQLGDVRAAVTAALADLRAVARGLYPVELAEEGLPAAFDVLQESSVPPLTVHACIADRPPQAVESAAYYAVVHCLVGASVVTARRINDVLRLEIETQASPPDLVAVQDRVGAVNGTVSIQPGGNSGCRIHVELPCGS